MRIVRYLLLALLIVLVVIVLGGAYIYNDWTRGVLPQTSGELRVAGLQDRVEILRDGDGVPHIYAGNLHDLYFAQGYTQAQDRWWQMEFYRHVASGRIQELTGQSDSLLGTDVFLRTIGWRVATERDLEVLDQSVLDALQAFADGVNAYIGGKAPGDLAFEYNVLGLTGVNFEIEPWTNLDTLSFGRIMAWDLAGNRSEEFLRAAMIEAVGEEMTDEYMMAYPYDQHPSVINEDELPQAASVTTAANPSDRMLTTRTIDGGYAGGVAPDTTFAFGAVGGSNNWVVSGALTASGMPLLANDPHLGIGMPSIWYEIGLHCAPVSDECPLDVVGFTFAPNNGVVVGHNARIAWGVTTLTIDVQDNYLLRVNPDNPLQYEWDGEWRDFTTRQEEIRFGDGGSMTITVRETHFGPVTNDNQLAYRCEGVAELIDPDAATDAQRDSCTLESRGFNNDDPIALRWTSHESSRLINAVTALNHAENWDDFRAALAQWDNAAQHFVYADVDGNIGYQTTGRTPIRAEGHTGLVPVEGWTSETEWLGYVPFEDLPYLYNPERGYIVTANNAPVPLSYFDALAQQYEGNVVYGTAWDQGYRAARITQLIEELAPHTPETFAQIHGDNQVLGVLAPVEALRSLTFDDATLTDARDWLLEWDGRFDMDSGRAALFAHYWRRLAQLVILDQFPDDYSIDTNEEQLLFVTSILEQSDNAWWDNAETADVIETRDDILRQAFSEGHAAVVAALGADRAAWRWGRLHTAAFVSNPLGASGIDVIEGIVNRAGYETGGCNMCVNAVGWDVADSDNFTVDWLPSFRLIVDFGDLSASQSITTTGQSGHASSDHYADQIERWRTVQYHPLLWTREQVDAAASQRLTLLPPG